MRRANKTAANSRRIHPLRPKPLVIEDPFRRVRQYIILKNREDSPGFGAGAVRRAHAVLSPSRVALDPYSLSMNSEAFGASSGRPLRFLISATSVGSMFVGTACQSLK